MHVISVGTKETNMNCIMMLFLLISVIYDIKEQKIPTVWLWGNLLIGIVYRVFFWKEGDRMDILFAMLPGMLIFIIAKITRQIGEGDGYLLMITGCFFSIQNHTKMLLLAFLITAGFSVGTVMIKRDKKNRRIPFAPFVFLASVIIAW